LVLNQVDGVLTQQGLVRLGPAVRNSNMPANGVVAYPINAQRQACYTIVAIATPGANLDMLVLDPWGRRIAYNVDPDSHPWVTTCPGIDGRAVARLQMASGSGEYYYAVYQGSPTVRANLSSVFGGAAETGPTTAQLDPGTGARIQTLTAQLANESFRQISDPHGIVFGRREDRNYQLNLQEGHCYVFATFGGQGARDTDAYLLSGGGEELVTESSDRLDANVRYCPPTTGVYQLRARMFSGEGPLFTVGYVQQRAATPAPEPVTAVIASSTVAPGLDENFRLLDADMRARGYDAMGASTRGQLAQAGTQDFAVSLEGGKCYAILAVGDNGVRDLDVILLQGERELDRDVEADPRPVVRVCPEQNGDFTIRIRMYSGQGNFIYAPYRWPRGTRGPFNLRGIIYVRLAEVTSLLGVEGYQPDVDATPGQGRLAREGQNRAQDIRLTSGQCYSILVVGGEGVNDLDVTLARGGTQLGSDGTRTAFPSVRYCADQTASYSLDVHARSGSGQYFYQVFRRQ
jgi:hypothetical protein